MVTKVNASQILYDTGTVQDALDAVTGPNGAASVGYTPAGVGAVATAVQAKLQAISVSVVDYGAVADWNGSTGTDNTAAFAAAVTYLGSVGGGELRIPPGRYKGRLKINRSNIHVVGYGAEIGFGGWETLTVEPPLGASNLGPFLAFPSASNTPIDPAAGAVFKNITLASQGSRVVTVDSASGIAAGDYCMMISGTSIIATPSTNYVPETCQIRKVIGVSGNDVWFDESNDVTITGAAEHPYLIKWDFVENIKIEGLTINNQFGAAYCNSFGGVVGLTLEKVTYEPTSAWGAFSASRNVLFDNCTVKNAYNGFSSARMCDDVKFVGCTVSCTDTNLSASENYFYFGEENQKNVTIIGCRGIDAGIFFYGGNGWTNITVSDSAFDVLKTGKSALRLTTFAPDSKLFATGCTFVSRGGVSTYPWDTEPNAVIALAFFEGSMIFNGCAIRQAGTGRLIGRNYYGTDTVQVFGEGAELQISSNKVSSSTANADIVLSPNGSGKVVQGNGGQSAVSLLRGVSIREANAAVSARQDDTNGGKVSFGFNGYANTQYSNTLTRPRTDMSAWALFASFSTSAYESGQSCILYHVTAGGTQNARWIVDASGNLLAGTDNNLTLGGASNRWSAVYAGTGTINTSDEREKQQIRDLSVAERAVAVALKGMVRAFKFNDAVVTKGAGARIHFGVIAQDVKAAFEVEGLVAEDYAILCYDEWDEQPEIVKELTDEDGQLTGETVITQQYRPAGNRYGVRYEELLAFIIAAL